MVWVMDSDKFPFRQAEIYHQFHGSYFYCFSLSVIIMSIRLDGFMPGEQYPESYNSLVQVCVVRTGKSCIIYDCLLFKLNNKVAYRSGAIKSTGCPDRAPPSL